MICLNVLTEKKKVSTLSSNVSTCRSQKGEQGNPTWSVVVETWVKVSGPVSYEHPKDIHKNLRKASAFLTRGIRVDNIPNSKC